MLPTPCLWNACSGGGCTPIKKTLVTINNKTEKAIEFVKIANATDMCTVGFLPRSYVKSNFVKNKVNKMVQVTELYSDSDNEEKIRSDNRNHGMAGCVFLDDIPIDE